MASRIRSMATRILYTPVLTEDVSPPLLSDKEASSDDGSNAGYTVIWERRDLAIMHWVTHGLTLAIIAILAVRVWISVPTHAYCHRLFNYYSPMSEDLGSVPFVETRFNGSLWHHSPFKGPPSPTVVEAWDSIKQYGIISATEEEINQLHRSHSLDTASKFPEIAGGGYVAMTMGTHQLHCLFWLWRDHHRDYFPEMIKNKEAIPEMYERHFEHCIDFVRQTIMCNFDMGLLTFDWVLDHPNPVPNTNSMHKCVDWGAAEAWMKDRAIKVPDGFVWSQPEDQTSLPWNP